MTDILILAAGLVAYSIILCIISGEIGYSWGFYRGYKKAEFDKAVTRIVCDIFKLVFR